MYILRCADGGLYVGSTSDVVARVARHQDGTASQYTASRRPVQLIYVERSRSMTAAVQRERQIKRWTRAKKEALVAGDLALLTRL